MTFKMTVVENVEEGATRLSTEEVSFRAPGASMVQTQMRLSDHGTCERYFFVELPHGYCNPRDFANRSSLAAILSGQLEIKTSDGQVRVLSAGDTLALRDTAFDAPSRTITVVSKEPVRALVIQIE